MKALSKRTYALIAAGLIVLVIVGGLLYLAAQSLTANILQGQLRRQGYPTAQVDGVRLYLDGIVVERIQLNDDIVLRDMFTPQSAPDIARQGVLHLIIRHWNQTVARQDDLSMSWPFPQAQSLSVENMMIRLALPLHDVTLNGTMKSLQPEPGILVLVMPFDTAQDDYAVQGKLDMTVDHGRLTAIDLNVDEGSFQSPDLDLKRVSGWFNAQYADGAMSQIQAQIMAGAARYKGQPYADAMVQYSHSETEPAQWTVTLNRAAESYFNSWVIKPTTDGRYAVQAASQYKDQTQTEVMISAAPLRLVPLLSAP